MICKESEEKEALVGHNFCPQISSLALEGGAFYLTLEEISLIYLLVIIIKAKIKNIRGVNIPCAGA